MKQLPAPKLQYFSSVNMLEVQLSPNEVVMYSYDTPIVYKLDWVVYIDEQWDSHSKTTTQHVCKYLNMPADDIRSAIKGGRFLIATIGT